ncbi:hypothetical protein AMK26_14080 [Streptomyces sp. CB03234]|uniref:hypothetical protein n=1 Tax=Streptomyces sp. (strain CB03234) TaxID=1703937 RepID=UPI00093FF9A8|nr:hypothetical protein [Streptomyces sp. CB03234]OKK04474.1 hypothetical protein AMK26_14080 [Streptomyces sp. CB03234]
MSTLAITGWGVLTPVGTGADEITAVWRERQPGLRAVGGMYDEALPNEKACAITDFDVRDHLGRKGNTSPTRLPGTPQRTLQGPSASITGACRAPAVVPRCR